MNPSHPSALPHPAAPPDHLLLIDTHVDTPQRLLDESWSFVTSPLGPGQLSLAAARAGGLHAAFFALWPEPTQHRGRFAHRTFALLEAVLAEIDRHPADLALCRTPQELLAARAAGRFAILLGIEGGHAIEHSLPLLRLFFRLGVRYMTLTWSNSNTWADSSGDLDDPTVPHHNGLSPFGREVVLEMNRLGMALDLSHVADSTFAEAIALTRAPILVTHSNARALTASPRNLTDDQLRAVARNGGCVMTNLYAGFLSTDWMDTWHALAPERTAAFGRLAEPFHARNEPVPYHLAHALDRDIAARIPAPPLSSLVAHIEHMRDVAGIDHIGFGSDFDGIPAAPSGLATAADLPALFAALRERAWSAADLTKFCGGNLLRVLHDVQSSSATA